MPFFEKREEEIFCKYKDSIDFPLHIHRHMEMLYVINGTVNVQVGTQNYVLHEGEMAVIFPGKMHSYRTIRKGCVLLIIAPSSFIGNLESMCYEYQPVHPILSIDKMSERLVDNLTELQTTTEPFLIKSLLQLIFVRLMQIIPLQRKETTDSQDILYSVMNLIAEHYQEDIRLDTAAEQLGISKWYLSHILNCTIGMRFREYVNTLRIAHAQELLVSTVEPILNIAMECGFQNLRTFNRVFLSMNNCSPSEYRKRFKTAYSEKPYKALK